jgi:hypothetical protein
MKSTLYKAISASALVIGLAATGMPSFAQTSPGTGTTGTGTTGTDTTTTTPVQTERRDDNFDWGWLGLLGLIGLAGLNGRKHQDNTVAYRDPNEARVGTRN